MADLAQFVNALLRDVAKARFGSDLYARDVARYYESDGLLRRFPVPRTEVSEVEFDVKFLVDALQLETTQHELTEATLATIFEPHTDRIAAAIIDAAMSRAGEEERRRLGSAPARIDLRQAVLKWLTEHWGRPLDATAKPDVAGAVEALRSEAKKFVQDELRPKEKERAAAEALADAVAKEVRLEPLLGALRDELERARAHRGDCRVEVVISGDRLQQAQAAAISTIRVKASVRNYVWTQVERHGETEPAAEAGGPEAPQGQARVWRALNAE